MKHEVKGVIHDELKKTKQNRLNIIEALYLINKLEAQSANSL